VEQLPDGSFNEDAAFKAELFSGHSHQPLVMNAGDTIRVHFFVGSKSQGWFIWAVVSDYGGTAEVNDPSTSQCPAYGGPFCIYPWYAFNGRADALTYGADYPGTRFDYGKANQFAAAPQCGGPFGPDSTYCATIIKPVPLGNPH
jgi:hypothetical protein